MCCVCHQTGTCCFSLSRRQVIVVICICTIFVCTHLAFPSSVPAHSFPVFGLDVFFSQKQTAVLHTCGDLYPESLSVSGVSFVWNLHFHFSPKETSVLLMRAWKSNSSFEVAFLEKETFRTSPFQDLFNEACSKALTPCCYCSET